MQIEGIAHVVKQLTTFQLTPSLDSPHYVVLKKTKEYEIRQYSPYLVAETSMPGARPAGGDGFNDLAGYIFGGNSRYVPYPSSCHHNDVWLYVKLSYSKLLFTDLT